MSLPMKLDFNQDVHLLWGRLTLLIPILQLLHLGIQRVCLLSITREVISFFWKNIQLDASLTGLVNTERRSIDVQDFFGDFLTEADYVSNDNIYSYNHFVHETLYHIPHRKNKHLK